LPKILRLIRRELTDESVGRIALRGADIEGGVKDNYARRPALKRAVLVASLVLVAGVTGDVTAQGAPKKQKVLVGFHDNRTVRYFDFGRIRLRPGNKLAPIWVFANGAAGQRSIFDTVPGNKRYSALRRVNTVTWTAGRHAARPPFSRGGSSGTGEG
jgi:hypothetical protein